MIRRRDIPGLLCPLLAGCGSSGGEIVRIGCATNLLETYLPQLTAELGYFRDEGLTVEVQPLVGSRQMESLISGSSDVIYQSFNVVLQFAAEGIPLHSFLVTMSALSACLAVSARQAGRIRQGKVDAGMINGSAYTVLARQSPGARLIVDPRTPESTREITGVDGFPNFCLQARSEWLERNPVQARKLTRAFVRTLRWVRSRTPEQVREKLPATLRSTDAQADLESLRILMNATTGGRMPPGAPAGVLRYLATANEKVRGAAIDLSATYTNEFVDQAIRDLPENPAR